MSAHQAQRRLARRRLLVSTFLVIAFFATSAYLLDLATGVPGDDTSATGASEPEPSTGASSSPAPDPTATSSPTPDADPQGDTGASTPTPELTEDADIPADGPGTFTYAESEGPVLGESGPLHRFRLAVEDNVAGETADPAQLAEFVDTTLGDERGWTAEGSLRFQRVPESASSDFTIYLATSGTTEQICATGGLQVVAPGLPDGGVSCRISGQVVLNLARWQWSVPHFVEQDVPLQVYREMVLNHEVGHQLGYGHEACTGQGDPAPVMQQQTIFLDGCTANAWPYVDGVRHTGPPMS